MNEQDNGHIATLKRPTTDSQEDWKAHWKQQGQPWRTEPEIDGKRQKELAQRRAIVPDIEKGIYPLKAWFRISSDQCDNFEQSKQYKINSEKAS